MRRRGGAVAGRKTRCSIFDYLSRVSVTSPGAPENQLSSAHMLETPRRRAFGRRARPAHAPPDKCFSFALLLHERWRRGATQGLRWRPIEYSPNRNNSPSGSPAGTCKRPGARTTRASAVQASASDHARERRFLYGLAAGRPPGFHSGFGPSLSSRAAFAAALITVAMWSKSTCEMSSDGR